MTVFKDLHNVKELLPAKGRLLSLDVGTKRIGIAMSDETRLVATPKLILKRQGNQNDFTKIANIIYENSIVAIIVGWPINLDGSSSQMSDFVERFSEGLDVFLKGGVEKKEFYQNIYLLDEGLSSFAARGINNAKSSRAKNEFYDDIAAAVILQDFLFLLEDVTEPLTSN